MKINSISNSLRILPHNNYKRELNYRSFTPPYRNREFASQVILANYAKSHILRFGRNIDYDNFKLPNGAVPDEYQISAAESLEAGKSVLVSAPTGTGKTAIAQYIISKNLKEGKKTFYTTPLKALSNQKLLEFRKIYGAENVGILTGDRRENANAPIVIMTTEVYRNMVFNSYFDKSKQKEDIAKTVIFDEFHYLGDADRGPTWEESIIFSPHQTEILGLSATIGNDAQLSQWLDTLKGEKCDLVHVSPKNRHVPLTFYEYDAKYGRMLKYDLFDLKQEKIWKNTHPTKLHRVKRFQKEQVLPYASDYISVVHQLQHQDKLPAIFFIFSKHYSRKLLNEFLDSNVSLTNNAEKKQIENIVQQYRREYNYIGNDLNLEALINGYAIHNAGILPIQKTMIEELFNKKLLKVVLATETLAAGINMPARTVVISSPEKPSASANTENGRRNLTANEYHQMAGRAGRRGIDKTGNVVNIVVNSTVDGTFADLVVAKPDAVFSKFEPDYTLIANYHKYTKDSEKIKNIFANSFRVYAADEEKRTKKINSIYKDYEAKSDLMEKEGFLEINPTNRSKTITPKGYLLQSIIGYPQIPLINLITSQALKDMSPEELVYLAGSIVGGQYHTNNIEEDIDNATQTPTTAIKNALFGVKNLLKENPAKKEFSNIETIVKTFTNLNVKYSDELQKHRVVDNKKLDTNQQTGALIYTFAYLNAQRPDKSIENWQAITELFTPESAIKDEGGYYNSISQTIDLLSQMIDLCNNAQNIPNLNGEKGYYKDLATKLKTSVKLLRQDPIQSYINQ